MTKNHDKNVNILTVKKTFEVKWKVFFIIFKGTLVGRYCLRLESAPVIVNMLGL